MNTQQLFSKPILKIGALLGVAYAIAQYLFYFGGREVIMAASFNSTIQLLTIMGLYFALHHCRRIFPHARFWQLFFFGIVIMVIAIAIKTVFSMLLYGALAPELGLEYKKLLGEQMSKMIEDMKSLPQEQYKSTTKAMLNAFTIPLLEGFSLFILGAFFSLFIAALHNMFRK